MATISSKGIPPEVADEVLRFLNDAQKPEHIAGKEPQFGPVYDDPDAGDRDGYDIGIEVATRLLAKRKRLGRFTRLEQLSGIRGFGRDKFRDLVFTAVRAGGIKLPAPPSLHGRPAVFPTDPSANKKSIYVLTTDGLLAQVWDTNRWNLDFPAELAGQGHLRFQGIPAVFPTNARANKKSIYVLTTDGRLAQMSDTNGWNLDFPAELAGEVGLGLRFQNGVAVFPTDAAANKKAIYAITTDGRLAQLWDTDRWNLDFPAEAAGERRLRFQGIPAVFPTNAGANKKSIYVLTRDGRLAQVWDTDQWNLDFPAELAGEVGRDLRFQGAPAVFPTNAGAHKKSIYVLTTDGRLAQVWDTNQWNLDFPLDPSLPGPFAVGEHDYPAGLTFMVPATTERLSEQSQADVLALTGVLISDVSTVPFSVTLRALVPTAGVDRPVATALAKYPLVIIAHGNHRVFSAPGVRVESFQGLDYLARHLASYGYIAVSIDLNDMNLGISRFPAIVQRGLTILKHIDRWGTFHASHPIFAGKVDLDQICLVGHSRGGEAVVSAQRTNVDQLGGRHKIKGVVSISPTDYLGIVLRSVPYLVVYGSQDRDVTIGWPFRLYDRASAFKAMIFVYGAIHNRFSTHPDWIAPHRLDRHPVSGLLDSRALSEAIHQNIAKGYCLGFLDMLIHNVGFHAYLFKHNGRPSTVPAGVELHHQVQDPTRLVVDDFEQGAALDRTAALSPQLATRALKNTLDEPVTVAGLVTPTGLDNKLTEASLQHRDIRPFWHDTVGGMVAWEAAGGTYMTPVGKKDVSAFAVLSFRVAQRFDSPRNPLGATQDCTVTIADSADQMASVRVGTVATIPYPYIRTDRSVTEPELTKSALKTIRIPLRAFTHANARLSLASIKSIGFVFGPAATGELALDDIEFSN